MKKKFPSEDQYKSWLSCVNLSEAILRSQLEQDQTIRELIEMQFAEKAKVSDEEIKAYYDSHPNSFKKPEQVKASHILIKVEPQAEESKKAEARKKLEMIKGKLKKGQDPFQEIVAKLSAQALCKLAGKQATDTLGNSYRYVESYAEKVKMKPYSACLKVLGETEKVLKMLRQLMPVTIAFARAQFQAGADIVVMADHVTGSLVGPYHYEELLLPIHQEITAQIEGPLILHVCGDCSDRLEYFAQSGVDAYHMEWQVDAKMAVEKVGTLMSLVGNVNNPQVLYQGTPEDVHQQVRYAVEAGINIIGPECAIPLSTPIENLKAIVAAAHEGY